MRETARRNWGHTGFAAHQTAVTSLADAEARLTGANADTSEEDLIAALASAANPNCQPSLAQGIISPVALAGAKALVGFAERLHANEKAHRRDRPGRLPALHQPVERRPQGGAGCHLGGRDASHANTMRAGAPELGAQRPGTGPQAIFRG